MVLIASKAFLQIAYFLNTIFNKQYQYVTYFACHFRELQTYPAHPAEKTGEK
jgi:hypothetical protein